MIPNGIRVPVWDCCNKICAKFTSRQNNFAQPNARFYPLPIDPPPTSQSHLRFQWRVVNGDHTQGWMTDGPWMKKNCMYPENVLFRNNGNRSTNIGVKSWEFGVWSIYQSGIRRKKVSDIAYITVAPFYDINQSNQQDEKYLSRCLPKKYNLNQTSLSVL